MEWEVRIIEWLQNTLGSLNSTVGTALSFIGGEIGLLLALLIILFCLKKETGKRLALTITAANTWLPMLKAAVMRLRPYMESPDRGAGRRGFWKQRSPRRCCRPGVFLSQHAQRFDHGAVHSPRA